MHFPGLNHETHGPRWFVVTVFDPLFKSPYFTGEETNGKFVNMHHLYLEFINLIKIKKSNEYKIGDCLWYLQHFDQYQKELLLRYSIHARFHEIPYLLKEKEYRKYKLKNLVEYLKDIFRWTQLLTNFNIIEKKQNSNKTDI